MGALHLEPDVPGFALTKGLAEFDGYLGRDACATVDDARQYNRETQMSVARNDTVVGSSYLPSID